MPITDVARLLLLAAVWGGSFIFIGIAVPVLGPFSLVEARVLIAGLVLLGFALATRQQLKWKQYWKQYLIVGALNSALPFVLNAYGQTQIPASFAAIINATSPLFGALIAAIWLKDRLTTKKLVGLAFGITGVAVLVGWSPVNITPIFVVAFLSSLSSAFFYGLASNYIKAKVVGAPSMGMAVGSQLGAALLLIGFVPVFPPLKTPDTAVILAVVTLAVLCTAVGYLLYFQLIIRVGAVNALTVVLIIPIFGMVWGAILLGEAISLSQLAGCLIILAGTTLVTGIRLDTLFASAKPTPPEEIPQETPTELKEPAHQS